MNRSAVIVMCLAMAGLAGLGLAFQGWRARGPDVDVIASMVRTVALVDRGQIPRRGNLTDHNAFRPPGTSWLMVPGALMFSDPRRVELTATGCVYLATLVGVFALARLVFGLSVGVWGTLWYAFSSIAINFAAVLQPKAYPLFVVWMTYCAVQWVKRRDTRWLAASCVVWAAGMYVHLEMAPFAVVVPALWLRYRPPLHVGPLMAGLVVVLVMWSPFLAFQWERGFIDLESQLTLRPLDRRGPITNWYCGEDPLPAGFAPIGPIVGDWRHRPAAATELLMMNFETRVPGGPLILLALMMGGMVMAFGAGRAGREGQSVIAIAVFIPGVLLLLLTEPGVPRLIGLWPLQVILMAACLERLAALASGSPIVRTMVMAAVMVIVAINLQVLQRVRDWPVRGWAGLEPAQVEWADFRSIRCEDER